jgi:hypothetical protein
MSLVLKELRTTNPEKRTVLGSIWTFGDASTNAYVYLIVSPRCFIHPLVIVKVRPARPLSDRTAD